MTQSPTIFLHTNPSGAKVWKVDVPVGIKPNGKPRFVRRTASTKREAHAEGLRLQLEAAQGALAPEGKERFRSFALRWLEETKAPAVRQATVEDYRYKLEQYIFPVFGGRKVNEITSHNITGWLKDLQGSGKSNYTINGVRQVLGAVLKSALAFGLISKNPLQNVPRYRQSRHNTVYVCDPWTLSEAQEALKALRHTSVELFGVLLIYLGLRKSEVIGLKWCDFDFEKSTLTVHRSVREIGIFQEDGTRKTGVAEEEPKTSASQRTLPLSKSVLEAVMRHRADPKRQRFMDAQSWVFSTQSGTVQRPGSLRRTFNRVLESNGVRRIRIHDIRHTTIVFALEAGTPIESVSQAAGHTRIDTTKSIYAPHVQKLSDRFAHDVANFITDDFAEQELRELIDQTAHAHPPNPSGGRGES